MAHTHKSKNTYYSNVDLSPKIGDKVSMIVSFYELPTKKILTIREVIDSTCLFIGYGDNLYGFPNEMELHQRGLENFHSSKNVSISPSESSSTGREMHKFSITVYRNEIFIRQKTFPTEEEAVKYATASCIEDINFVCIFSEIVPKKKFKNQMVVTDYETNQPINIGDVTTQIY